MRLFLIRHGAVSPPRPGMFYGGTEVPLSVEGEAQARRAAAALATEKVDHVVCSPLGRARFGAERVAEICGIGRPEVFEGLREIDRGRWLGLLPEEIEKQHPGDLKAHEADPEAWTGHGGESLGQLRDRVLAVRNGLLERWDGATVALVSHLWPTRALLADACGWGLERWGELRVPTGSVSAIRRDPGGARWEVVGEIGVQP